MAQYRKDPLLNGNLYHIYTRSIAKYVVFNDPYEYERIFELLHLCQYKDFSYRLSQFNRLTQISKNDIVENLKINNNLHVKVVAYCLMPTHIHLILQQISKNGIEKYMSKILNGYSRYFNVKHQRTGPLWSTRFKSVLVKDDEQLLHLTRYIHLNPTSAEIIEKTEDWEYSSYKEYIDISNKLLCDFRSLSNINPKSYKKFVNDRKDYQKELSKIKSLIIDDYSG